MVYTVRQRKVKKSSTNQIILYEKALGDAGKEKRKRKKTTTFLTWRNLWQKQDLEVATICCNQVLLGGWGHASQLEKGGIPNPPMVVDHVGINVPEQRLDHSSALLLMTTKSWEQLATNDSQDLIPDTILSFTWENANVQATHMVHF